MQAKHAMVSAGMLGGTGVVLGAFGAHLMRKYLQEAGFTDVWETAVRFQLIHAAALVGIAGKPQGGRDGRFGFGREGSSCSLDHCTFWRPAGRIGWDRSRRREGWRSSPVG
jgi:uncharacterized membrane protein YgdD (TMEM256/DUF423 family)